MVEKENKDDSESIEAVRDNEIVEVAVEQKILQKQEDRSPDESDKDEPCIEKEDLESNEKDVAIKVPKDENSKQESVNSEHEPGQAEELNRKDMADPALQICDTICSLTTEESEKPRNGEIIKAESPVCENLSFNEAESSVPDRKSSMTVKQDLSQSDETKQAVTETVIASKSEDKKDSNEADLSGHYKTESLPIAQILDETQEKKKEVTVLKSEESKDLNQIETSLTVEQTNSNIQPEHINEAVNSPISEKEDTDRDVKQNQDDTKEEKSYNDYIQEDTTETEKALKSEELKDSTESPVTDRKLSLTVEQNLDNSKAATTEVVVAANPLGRLSIIFHFLVSGQNLSTELSCPSSAVDPPTTYKFIPSKKHPLLFLATLRQGKS